MIEADETKRQVKIMRTAWAEAQKLLPIPTGKPGEWTEDDPAAAHDRALRGVADALEMHAPTYRELAEAYRMFDGIDGAPELTKADTELKNLAMWIFSREYTVDTTASPPVIMWQEGKPPDVSDVGFGPIQAGTAYTPQWGVQNDFAANTLLYGVTSARVLGSWAEGPAETLSGWLAAWDAGYRGRYPWASVIRWWHEMVRQVGASTRRDPIFPAPVIVARQDSKQGRLFSHHVRWRADGQLYLPTFAPGEGNGPKTPVLPPILYNLGLGNKPGRGAPIPIRLWVECVLQVPNPDRAANKILTLPPVTLREVVQWVGWQDYRPSKDANRLINAVETLQSKDARIPWFDLETGRGGARQIVSVLDIPRDWTRLDDVFRFSVMLPPGSDKGPIVDRRALRAVATHSAIQYRMVLGLAFTWWQPGRLRLPIRKGVFRQVRSESALWRYDDYAQASDENLLSWAYPHSPPPATPSGRRNRLQRAREALRKLEQLGYCRLLPSDGIMPGPRWTGWGPGPENPMHA